MFINEAKKIIEMSAVEYKKAMTHGTEEYNALREIRADFPGFKAVEMKPKKGKTPLDKLTLKDIKDYVKAHGSETQKQDFLDMSVARYTDEGAYIEAKPFFEIKKWFLAEFPKYKEALDNHEAEMKKIFDAVDKKIAEAKAKAAKEACDKAMTEAKDYLKAS